MTKRRRRLAQKVADAIWDTLQEFGLASKKKPKKKKSTRPSWMDLRKQRLPVKREVKREVKKEKTKVVQLRDTHRLEIKREQAVMEPWEEKAQADQGFNEVIEGPQDRVKRILTEPVKKKLKKNRQFYENTFSRKRKHLLFMNPGTGKIKEAMEAITSNAELPTWAQPFEDNLRMEKGRLMFDDLRMATNEEKREAVKRQYFDPKGPSTIAPICDVLREKFANVSKGNVTRILRSLETYQRNFGRRRPPKIMGRMSLKNPGIIAMDMFFPTKKIAGWEGKWSCLTCMDCWSRYTHVYACVNKKFATVEKAMTMFLQEFAGYGFMPRRILCDRGTDLAPAKKVMEKYRTNKDTGAMVAHSQTAQPVNIIEVMNSEVQRHMQVFRTSGITDDPSVLLEDISYAINHKKRQARGNLTPIQLLSLNKEERQRVNDMEITTDAPEVSGLPELKVGHAVRVLLWSRKEQAQNAIKGFTAKWSKDVYTVLRKTAIPKNRNNYRYYVGTNQTFYRHELLKIPRQVDTQTYDMVSHRQVYVAPEEAWSDLESDYDD